ncbi:MAG: glycoside hydrolase family 125 protein [Bacteroidales bacterium]|jgi:meiotically up-regulated gene 157 (Mug157) protein|nr:glycoside hydrolase family 125 protein [Bacteroidales bacterium]
MKNLAVKLRLKALSLLCVVACLSSVNVAAQTFPTVRIDKSERNFISSAVDAKIAEMQSKIKDPELAWMFGNCFPNTIDRTVNYTTKNGQPNTFVITGDIHAMWLRDCSAQVWPYMPYMNDDAELKNLVAGMINRQVESVLIDPYANAFNLGSEGGEWMTDHTTMRPELHERKWEIDGLCYVIRVCYNYWKITGDVSLFDAKWQQSMELIVKTFKEQQRKENRGPYSFTRTTAKASDTQFGAGYGNPIRPTGMICSMFRPSDDATTYAFLIPSNCFAVVSLNQLAEMELEIKANATFATECSDLASEVDAAIMKHGVVKHPKYGKIFAFEVDGYGNYLMMDDANVPSLLSLPYLGYIDADKKLYKNTRKFIWSLDNPYFYKGTAGEGIGGPHVGPDMVWPMSIIMKALTSDDKEEIASCLELLKNTHGGTGFMHETFHKDDPKDFTRSWFAWANTLFGELLIQVENDYPELLERTY